MVLGAVIARFPVPVMDFKRPFYLILQAATIWTLVTLAIMFVPKILPGQLSVLIVYPHNLTFGLTNNERYDQYGTSDALNRHPINANGGFAWPHIERPPLPNPGHGNTARIR